MSKRAADTPMGNSEKKEKKASDVINNTEGRVIAEA